MTRVVPGTVATPDVTAQNILEVVRRLKTSVDSMAGQADPLNRVLTVRDASGIDLGQGRVVVVGGGSSAPTTSVPGPSDYDPETDYATPPAPQDLVVNGGYATVILRWGAEPPSYRNPGFTQVWVNTTDNLGTATLLGISTSNFYVHEVGAGQTRYYWVRYVSASVPPVTGPYNATTGTVGTTAIDISAVLLALAGQIRETELYSTLSAKIALIDAPISVPGSVNARVQALQDQINTLTTAPDYDAGTTYSVGQVVKYGGKLYRAKATTTGNLPTNTAFWDLVGDFDSLAGVVSAHTLQLSDHESRITVSEGGITAEVAAREALAAQMRGTYAGTDVAAVTTGLIASEKAARVSADGAAAARLDIVESSINAPSTGLLARAAALESVTTDVSYGNAALATRTSALESTVNTPSTGLVARAIALELVTTNVTSGNAALASRASALEASVNNPTIGLLSRALVLENRTTDVTSGNAALATRSSQLEASVNSPTAGNNPTYAAVLTAQSAIASLDGSVQALYTVRAQVSAGGRTLVGGFGLSATSTAAGGPTIDFGVLANRFWVGAPAGSGVADVAPFVIATTTFNDNGVLRPAGVYIDAAYIRNLTAVYATIGTLVSDQIASASISTAQLTAGALRVGGYIESTNFAPGVAGWRIRANGEAEFSGVIVRGTVYAGAGSIGGITISANSLQSSNYSPSTTGWRIHSDGSVDLNNASIRGTVSVGSATGFKVGTGFWTGLDGGVAKLFVGTAAGPYFAWNGADVEIVVNSNSLTFLGPARQLPMVEVTSFVAHPGGAGTVTAYCSIRVTTDGLVQFSKNNGASWTTVDNWFRPTTANAGGTVGSPSFYMKLVPLGTYDAPTGSAINTWLPLTSNLTWTYAVAASEVSPLIEKFGLFEVFLTQNPASGLLLGNGRFIMGAQATGTG